MPAASNSMAARLALIARSPRDPLGCKLAGDEHHRHADTGLAVRTRVDEVFDAAVECRRTERAGLREAVRRRERCAGGDSLRRPVRGGDQMCALQTVPELGVAAVLDGVEDVL